jgi:hypothetical protein
VGVGVASLILTLLAQFVYQNKEVCFAPRYIESIAANPAAIRCKPITLNLKGATMESQKNVTTPAPVSIPLSVIEARNALVKAETKTYGARITYAVELNSMAGSAWYRDGAEKIVAVETEKSNLYAALKKVGHSNPSKVWGDVKKYALIDAQEKGLFGEVKPEPTEGGEGESTGGANINAPRPLQLRLIEELTALYKVCEKERAFLTDKQKDASLRITQALQALGVDVGLIKTGK